MISGGVWITDPRDAVDIDEVVAGGVEDEGLGGIAVVGEIEVAAVESRVLEASVGGVDGGPGAIRAVGTFDDVAGLWGLELAEDDLALDGVGGDGHWPPRPPGGRRGRARRGSRPVRRPWGGQTRTGEEGSRLRIEVREVGMGRSYRRDPKRAVQDR